MICRQPTFALLSRALLLATLIILPAHGANADSALVELTATLEPATGAVPGQRIKLVVNIATPRWFTAGTRIKLPEVPGLILLQNQDFAANATERRGAESWTLQRWTIDLFATEVGAITIPPIAVSVSVSESPSREYKDTLYTETLTVETQLPPALAQVDHWIASPEVSLEQKLALEQEVPLGGAIRRQISIKARDVMAMQLPAVSAVQHPNLQTYPEPPVLRNRANRGSLNAERRDSVTWIATTPGEINLPGATINWWNTDTGTLTQLNTDPVTVIITGEPAPRPINRELLIRRGVYGLGVLTLLGVGIWLIRRGALHYILSSVRTMAGWWARVWHIARAPVLPERLNPDGTQGASSAGKPPSR